MWSCEVKNRQIEIFSPDRKFAVFFRVALDKDLSTTYYIEIPPFAWTLNPPVTALLPEIGLKEHLFFWYVGTKSFANCMEPLFKLFGVVHVLLNGPSFDEIFKQFAKAYNSINANFELQKPENQAKMELLEEAFKKRYEDELRYQAQTQTAAMLVTEKPKYKALFEAGSICALSKQQVQAREFSGPAPVIGGSGGAASLPPSPAP